MTSLFTRKQDTEETKPGDTEDSSVYTLQRRYIYSCNDQKL